MKKIYSFLGLSWHFKKRQVFKNVNHIYKKIRFIWRILLFNRFNPFFNPFFNGLRSFRVGNINIYINHDKKKLTQY
jgi:hypothetical protein